MGLRCYGHTIGNLHVCIRLEDLCFDRRSSTEVRIKPLPDDATQRISSATATQTDTLRDSRADHTVPVLVFLDNVVHNRHVTRKSHLAVASFLSFATYETVLHRNIVALTVFAMPVMLHSTEHTLDFAFVLDLVRLRFSCSFCYVSWLYV